nr:septum formation family protein [Galbitalea soli]
MATLAGAVVGGVLLAAALTGCAGHPATAVSGEIATGRLTVGQCVDDRHTAGTLATVPVVPCSAAHDSEVFDVFALPDGAFPGDAEVTHRAITGCSAAFTTFTGVAPASTVTLDFSWFFPTAASWKRGDRGIQCLVFSVGSGGGPTRTIGTLQNAGR